MSEVLSSVQTILKNRVGADPAGVTLESSLKDDVGIDSVDIVEFVVDLEKTFHIDIPDSEASKLKTVGDVVNLVTQLQSSPS